MSSQDEAATQRDEKKLREQMLGKRSLKSRIGDLSSGIGAQKVVAVERERTKLAKLLAARQLNGERDRTRRKRKTKKKPKAQKVKHI